MKKILLLALLLATNFAHAQTVADIVNQMIPQIKNIPQVMYIISYLCGLAFGIKGAIKLKEANESRGQVKISSAMILLIAAGLFLALPTLVNVGIEFMGFEGNGQFKY